MTLPVADADIGSAARLARTSRGGRYARVLDLSAPGVSARSAPPVVAVVPTYNEIDNLERLHRRFRDANPGVGLLVVDDNSPDGTGAAADAIAERDPLVFVLHRRNKEGLGAAYLAGINWALGSGAQVVVQMDADGSHAPEALPLVLAALANGADVVIGSRYTPGGCTVGWSWYRAALSKGGNWYARRALQLSVRDVTGGFRAWSRRSLEAISGEAFSSQGYCFLIELSLLAVRDGLRVVEVPITFVEREAGASKMSPKVAFETLRRVTSWAARAWFSRRRPSRPTPLERSGDDVSRPVPLGTT